MARAVRYRVLNKIAHGGMAEIFLALQTGAEGFQKTVVLKRILPALAADPSFVGMLVDEAHIASTLNHSNLVQVLDLGKSGDQYFLVLEFVDGWSLEQVRRRAQKARMKMPLPLALYVVGSLCRALAYVHTRKRDGRPLGIVHRDVTPQNVLISREGEVKLADFGIAKAIGKREKSATGVIKGKFAYMSPEQSIGIELDARSDLFSVGTLLYILTTGKKPFDGATDLDVLMQVRKARFEKPSVLVKDFNPDVERFIARAMRPDLSRRWQTAEQMADRIDAILVKLAQPSGAAVFKRWLETLSARDGMKAPAEVLEGGAVTGTVELGSRDLELHDIESVPGHDEPPSRVSVSAAAPQVEMGATDADSVSIEIIRPAARSNARGAAVAAEPVASARAVAGPPLEPSGRGSVAAGRRSNGAAIAAHEAEAVAPLPARRSTGQPTAVLPAAEVPARDARLREPAARDVPARGAPAALREAAAAVVSAPAPAPESERKSRAAAKPDAKADVKPDAKADAKAAAVAPLSPRAAKLAGTPAAAPLPWLSRVRRFLRRLTFATIALVIVLGAAGYFARSYLPAWLVEPVAAWLRRLPPPVGVGEYTQ